MTPCLDPRDLTPETTCDPTIVAHARRLLDEAKADRDAANDTLAAAEGVQAASRMFYRWGREKHARAQWWAYASFVWAVTAFSFLLATLALGEIKTAQRDAIHRAEMREIARLRR